MKFAMRNLEDYLREVLAGDVEIRNISELGGEGELKGFGYGKPYIIDLSVNGEGRSVVLSSMKGDSFGHDHFSDRAQILIWQHDVFNKLPRHVKSIDVGFFTGGGELKSAGNAEEYFIVTEKVDGDTYFLDLERLKGGEFKKLDEERVIALSTYLAEVHSVKKEDDGLYIRRIRDLIGHGECIMGLMDSYLVNRSKEKSLDFVTWKELEELEKACVEWRWKLKEFSHRLCVVHGDFHPWNIIFRGGTDFTVLDRSRGEWGEAADDVSSMTINYIFYSLNKYGRLDKEFKRLYELFLENYMEKTNDDEIFSVIQPFYAFRALVVASPIWYPSIGMDVRRKLFNFMRNVLHTERFEPENVNAYIS
jgi:hypothetical protein